MKLVDFIRKESKTSLPRLFLISATSGIANALLLVIVNLAVENTAGGSHTFQLLLLFVLLLAIFAIARKYLIITLTNEFEGILHKVRSRIADKIRKMDLFRLEALGRADIYASLQRDILLISGVGKTVVTLFQAILLFVFTMIYIGILSSLAFLYTGGIILSASFIYVTRKRLLGKQLAEVLRRENKVFESLSHVLDGIKEVQINSARSEELNLHMSLRSDQARALRSRTEHQFTELSVFAQVALYIGLGALVFVLPTLYPEFNQDAIKVTTAFIFLIGPIFNTVGMVPAIYNAEAAINSIMKLEAKIDEGIGTVPNGSVVISSFREIRLEDIFFQFPDPRSAHPFKVGPLRITISAGEVLFLSGGNGSGKSTLLKLLTGLYYPQEGSLSIDGTEVGESNRQAYRNLFSTVFADFHLFDRLYGLGEVDPKRVEELFRELGLEGKTKLVGGEFETLDLSTGQRKRLALLIAILEDRPIYIFDEWAADQDPMFRKKFYKEIIPRLKSAGKTVIAVTHDDRYFDASDKLLRMEEGKLVNHHKEDKP